MTLLKLILLTIFLVTCQPAFAAGTFIKGPALIEGFTTVTSAAGTTTLTKDSETKQILTGATTQTFVLPDATTLPLGRYFNLINKSSGTMTVQTSGGGALTTVDAGVQKEVHLRAAGSAAGTWDVLAGGGGGVWGSITGTLSAQTDLNTALGLKAPAASPTFTGTIGTPLTASKLLATDASGNLTATAANSSQAAYLDFASSGQTQLNGKLSLSNYSAKGDIVAGVSSGTVSATTLGAEGSVLISDPNNISNGIRWGNLPGQENYIKNSQLESGSTTGWAVYADAAGTSPVDCTGGSPNSTIAASSTSPLNGTYSALTTLNTGASRQGEGYSYAFSIPAKYSTAPAVHQIEFDYRIAGGTFVAGNDTDRTSAGDSTYTVWVYDVTNAQLIQPSTYRLYSNVGGKFIANFQNNAGSTSYRLCIHKGTTTSVSGTNITTKFDDFKVSPSSYVYGTPISDWISYTPSNTQGLGTIASVNLRWRRVGDTMQIQGGFTTGTVTGSTAQLGLPSGSTVGGTASTRAYVGETIRNGGSRITNFAIQGATYLTFGGGASSHGDLVGTSAFGSTEVLYITAFDIPIQGWSSSVQQSDGYDGRLIALKVNSGSTTGTLNTSNNVVKYATTSYKDTTASYSSSTGLWTCPKSGWYIVSGSYAITHTTAVGYIAAKIDISGSIVAEDYKYVSGVGDSQQSVTSQAFYINAGQTVGLYSNTNLTTPVFGSDPARNWLSIVSVNAPTTMSATEVVAASYRISADKTPSASNPIDYDTKIFDTHNAVTTGASWKFTAPVQGLYRITTTNATSTTGGTLDLYVNGSQDRGMMSMSDTSVRSASATVSLLAGGYISINPDSASKTFTGTKNNTIYIERIK